MIKHMVAAAAILGSATAANAATVFFVGTPGVIGPGQQLINTFNTAAEQAAVSGSGFIFQSGTNSQGAAIFGGDGTTYLSILANGSATTSTIFLGNAAAGVFLDIGSVDSYNRVTLNFSNSTSQTFTGSQIAMPANGSQTSLLTNGRFFFDGQGLLISSISFGSIGANALEVDNLAVAAIPEPATWGMMILGFGIVGAAMRRRSRTTRVFA